MSHYESDDEYVVVEKGSNGVVAFLMGAAIGAGLALVLAPRSGRQTRRDLKRRARRVQRRAERVAAGVTDSVTGTLEEAREKFDETMDAARETIAAKKRDVRRAVNAGRAAADDARFELRERIAASKAALRGEGDRADGGGRG